MKSLHKYLGLVFVIIALASCDVMSDLFTTNHFEQFKDINPFSLVTNVDFNNLTEPSKMEIIEDYTTLALSDDDSEDFFSELSESPTFRNDVTDYFRTLLDTEPVIGSDTYEEDLALYQKRAMALANIEIFTRTASAVTGFNELAQGYITGELDSALSVSTFITEIFNVPDPTSYGYNEATVKADLRDDLYGAIRAGYAIEKLGSTITDVDNPSSDQLDQNDGDIVLISCLLSRIVEINSGFTESEILDELRDRIFNNNMSGTFLVFPQDVASSSNNIVEHYLGVGGALAFTATGFELPGISLFGGTAS